MTYQAIARKWRPTTFEEIAGQGHVTQTLQNAIRLDRVHHGFLFTGARGVGKTTAARVLARALNCEQGPTPTPCGECGNCLDILAGACPDVIEIDGASNNSVDDVRDLRDSVRYLPQRGRKKIYIVDEVHMLSKGAFNALLKTLEEPPEHVVFIFATTEPHRIPDTILSRVQRFDFKRISASVVVERLQRICEAEGIQIPEDGLRLVARAGEGSMRDAQSLLDRVISFSGNEISREQVIDVLGLVDRELLYDMLEGILKGNADKCLEAIEKVHGFGYDLSEFTAELLELIRNATLVTLSSSSQRYIDVSKDERERLEALSQDVPSEVFVRSFQVLIEVHDQVSRSERPRMVLEMAVARLVSIRPARPLDQILDRLASLERRIRQQGGQVSSRPSGRGNPGSSRPSGSRGPVLGGGPEGRPNDPQAALATELPAIQGEENPREAPTPQLGLVELPPEPDPEISADSMQGEQAQSTDSVESLVPTAVAEDASDLDRFRAFQQWLEQGGPRFEVWAHDSALNGRNGAVLSVLFPSEFKKRNAAELSRDPHLLQGLESYFPGCQSVQISLRNQAEMDLKPSRREQDAVLRVERLAQLRRESAADPLIMRIVEQLDAEICEVLPSDELPSVLDPS